MTVLMLVPPPASPAAPAEPLAAAAPPLQRRLTRYDVDDLQRKFEWREHTVRTVIAKLRVLVDHHGFPLPRNPRIVRKRRLQGGLAVCKASVWDRDEVDSWIEGDQPPPAAAAATRRDALRGELANRARGLAQSGTLRQAEEVA